MHAPEHHLNNVDELLFVVECPVDLVVVASAQVHHNVLRARHAVQVGLRLALVHAKTRNLCTVLPDAVARVAQDAGACFHDRDCPATQQLRAPYS